MEGRAIVQRENHYLHSPSIILIPAPITAALLHPQLCFNNPDINNLHRLCCLCCSFVPWNYFVLGVFLGGRGVETAARWPSTCSRWAEQIKYSKLGCDFTAAKSRLDFGGRGRVCLINSITQHNESSRRRILLRDAFGLKHAFGGRVDMFQGVNSNERLWCNEVKKLVMWIQLW